MYQRIDQFDLFLAGMSGYMGILENHLRTLHGQFIDHLGHCLLIARNRVGAENNRIIGLDGDLLVDASLPYGTEPPWTLPGFLS